MIGLKESNPKDSGPNDWVECYPVDRVSKGAERGT